MPLRPHRDDADEAPRALPPMFARMRAATATTVPLSRFRFTGQRIATHGPTSAHTGHSITPPAIDRARADLEIAVFATRRGLPAAEVRRELTLAQSYGEELRRQLDIDAVEAEVRGVLDVDTVIYPAAGHDAGLAARLFPRGRELVGIDHGAFTVGDGDVEVPIVPAENVSYVRDVGRGPGGMAGAIIGSLASHVPGFQLRRVTVLADGKRRHGIVEFEGEDGVPRRYVHIQHALSEDTPEELWYDGIASGFGRVGLLVKGAQGQLHGAIAEPMIELLRLRGGVAVVGQAHGGGPDTPIRIGHPRREHALEVRLPRASGLGYHDGSRETVPAFVTVVDRVGSAPR